MSSHQFDLKPNQSKKSQHRQHRQISRIIKHLRDQLPKDSNIYRPSDTVIDSLVQQTLLHYYFKDEDWSLIVKHTLGQISQLPHYELPNGLAQVERQRIRTFAEYLLREMSS